MRITQWGLYLAYAWFITWLLQLSNASHELLEVRNILTFSKMYPSLISSICSLSYGQYLAHIICYKYRTSGKQKLAYLLSCFLMTLCTVCILLSLQTAVMDLGGTWDLSFYKVAILLMTPVLYKYMVLPSSDNKFLSVSLTTPSFLHGLMMQCYVFSFYIFQTAAIDLYLYISHHLQWRTTVSEIAFQRSRDESFLGKY